MEYPLPDNTFSKSLSGEATPSVAHLKSGSTNHTEDGQLWKAFKNGDRQIFSFIYTANAKDLYRYGTKITTDEELVRDSIQDLFIELWRNRQSLGETDSIKYYLRKGLRRKIIHQITYSRKNIIRESLFDDYDMDVVVSSYEHALIINQQQQEQKEKIKAALEQLTRRQKQALALKFFDELSYTEIAGIMSLSHQSVYNLIHRALEILKNKLIGLVSVLSILQFLY
jgi:RNA polymerase sigma factor (sigma-70 family)